MTHYSNTSADVYMNVSSSSLALLFKRQPQATKTVNLVEIKWTEANITTGASFTNRD